MSNQANKGARVAQQLAAMQRAQAQMKSITNHQQKRGSNGISWQASPQNSGSPAQSQPGKSVTVKTITPGNIWYSSTLGNWSTLSVWGGEEDLEPIKTTGFVLGEIVAFRGWRVTPQGFLRSMSANVIWGPGEPMEGKTETKREHNGIYAYKSLKDFLGEHAEDLDIYGKVALWGDVIEHELGYRAQFAKVISLEHFLTRPAPYEIDIKELRQKYCEEAA